jgi:hypothetical protein
VVEYLPRKTQGCQEEYIILDMLNDLRCRGGGRAWWCMPVALVTGEDEPGEWHEPTNFSVTWATQQDDVISK